MPNIYTDQWIFIMVYPHVPTIQIKYRTFLAPEKAPLFLFPVNIHLPSLKPSDNYHTVCYHDDLFHLLLKLHLHGIMMYSFVSAFFLSVVFVKFIHGAVVALVCSSVLQFSTPLYKNTKTYLSILLLGIQVVSNLALL